MNSLSWVVPTLILFAGFGVSTFIWLAMDSANNDLRSFIGFEGMHFED